MLGILVNVMICGSFGFDRRMGYRVARGPFLHATIGFQTRPYNSASTTVLHVMIGLRTSVGKHKFKRRVRYTDVFVMLLFSSQDSAPVLIRTM